MDALLVRENKRYYAFPLKEIVTVLERPQIIPYAFANEVVQGICNYYGSPILYTNIFKLRSTFAVPFGLVLKGETNVCIGVSNLVHIISIPESAVPVSGDFSFQFTKVAYIIKNRMIELIDIDKLISWIIDSLKEERR